MSGKSDQKLVQILGVVATRIAKQRGAPFNEEMTKAALINPVLAALGWDLQNPDEVFLEFKHTPKANPVDYALCIRRTARLVVEAKALGQDLTEYKWVAQVLFNASAAGASWCVQTNGDEYRLYNATAPVPAEQKLLCSVKVSEGQHEKAARILSLVSRDDLQENEIESCWNAYYVDRQVRDAVRGLFSGPHAGLVQLVGKAVPKISRKDITNAIRRLDARVESPAVLPERLSGRAPKKRVVQGSKPTKAKKSAGGSAGVSLSDLVAAGLVAAPLRLFCTYMEKLVEATVLADGAVLFNGERYDTCSAAGAAAKGAVTGKPKSTNGWEFWNWKDTDGRTRTIGSLRDDYARRARVAESKPGAMRLVGGLSA